MSFVDYINITLQIITGFSISLTAGLANDIEAICSINKLFHSISCFSDFRPICIVSTSFESYIK